MDQIASRALPPGTTYEWTAMSYQETIVGNQLLYVFALAILLVYLCLAGQYESWIAPLGVILAVPLALVGPAIALGRGRPAQQPLHPDRPDAADRARRQERHPDRRGGARGAACVDGKPIAEAAVEAAITRLRPILMTSFAFILGVVPLVTATGAGARGPRLARPLRVQRHDRLDLPRRAVRAVLLHGAAALRGARQGAQGQEGCGEARIAPARCGGCPTAAFMAD